MTSKSCLICGQGFVPRVAKQQCCSKSCAGYARGPSMQIQCPMCAAFFKPRTQRTKHCSKQCADAALIKPVDMSFIESNSIPEPNSGCWLWLGPLHPDGYGVSSRLDQRAHRTSFIISTGRTIPKGLLIRHTCDNPPCVNPAHLLLGTYQDNMDDKMRRGRHRNVPRKLSETQEADVILRLRAGDLQKNVAADYGVSQQLISHILHTYRAEAA